MWMQFFFILPNRLDDKPCIYDSNLVLIMNLSLNFFENGKNTFDLNYFSFRILKQIQKLSQTKSYLKYAFFSFLP
jgi:hypothetical protein